MANIASVLNTYSGIISMVTIIILALLVLIIVRKVWLGFQKFYQPYVVLYITKLNYDEVVNYFVLENFGKTAASNVMVRINPDLKIEYPKDNPIEFFFDRRISVLAPSQRILSALPPGEYLERRYDCTITYEDDHGKIYNRTQLIDFSYTKLILFAASPESKIVKGLDKISHSLEHLSATIKK